MAAVLAGAVAARGRVPGRSRVAGPVDTARERARELYGRFRPSPLETYTCDCGKRYRFSGADRHRVYWPADASSDAPVLGDRCVDCDAPLPTSRATSAPA